MVAHLTKTLELLLSASHTSSLVPLPYSLTYLPSEFCICSPPPQNVFLHIHRLALSILRISVQIPFQSVLAHPIYNSSSSSHTSSSSCLSTMQLVLACCVTHPWVLSACPSCNGNLAGQRLLQTITPSNTRMMSEVQAWDENCWVIQKSEARGPHWRHLSTREMKRSDFMKTTLEQIHRMK